MRRRRSARSAFGRSVPFVLAAALAACGTSSRGQPGAASSASGSSTNPTIVGCISQGDGFELDLTFPSSTPTVGKWSPGAVFADVTLLGAGDVPLKTVQVYAGGSWAVDNEAVPSMNDVVPGYLTLDSYELASAQGRITGCRIVHTARIASNDMPDARSISAPIVRAGTVPPSGAFSALSPG